MNNADHPENFGRDMEPRGISKRGKFEEISQIIYRYSKDVSEMNREELIYFLDREVKELKSLNPYISLVFTLAEKGWDVEEDKLMVGAYKLISPPMKMLNDHILGPNTADQFIKGFQELFSSYFGENIQVLHKYFKGGHFVLKIETAQDGAENNSIDDVRKKLVGFQNTLTEILGKYILEKHGENGKYSDHTAHASFGVSELKSLEMKEAMLSIFNAEIAANIAALRTSEGNNTNRSVLQEFKYEYLLKDLLRARDVILHKVTEDGQIKEGFEDFFEIGEDLNVYMNKYMINIYRKKDAFLENDHRFTDLSDEEKTLFLEKLNIFEKYYAAINIIDVLKDFRVANFLSYQKRSENLIDLIAEIEDALENGDTVLLETLQSLLAQSSEELELSLKDEGKKISHTFRATIKNLMNEGKKFFIFADHINFGGRNLHSLEEDASRIMTLCETDEITVEDLSKKIADYIDANRQDYTDILLSPGDNGSKYLRYVENTIYSLFEEILPVIDSSGGDETIISALHTIETVDEHFHILREALKLRIVVVLNTDFSFSKIEDPSPQEISEECRREIVYYLKLLEWVEDQHSALKEKGDSRYIYIKCEGLKLPQI